MVKAIHILWHPMVNTRHWVVGGAIACGVFAGIAPGQLVPERLYHGVDRPLVMTVEVPEGVEGAIEVRLFDQPGKPSIARCAAVEGRVDLAGLFPDLWRKKNPTVLYAQLMVGERGVGSPVVLDPMVNPDRARLVDPGTLRPTFDPSRDRSRVLFDSDRPEAQAASGASPMPEGFTDKPVFAGVRAYAARFIVWETSLGEVTFRLRPDVAPNTAFLHLHLVEGGFYHEIEFHRIVDRLDSGERFVVQVGDPTSTGNGGPGFDFDLEKSSLEHRFGVLSMARAGDPDTNGSQVFVALSRAGTARLDGRYAAFGELVEGAVVLNEIAGVEVDENDRPIETVVLREVRSEPAPPMAEWAEAPGDPSAGDQTERTGR